jgi:membrane-associated phospholipid phosphatase
MRAKVRAVIPTWERRDLAGVLALRTLPHAATTDRVLAGMSRATDHATGWMVVGALAATVDRRRRAAWLLWTAGVVSADRASVAIKHVVRRGRPTLPGLPPLASAPSPLSFPSSHTASAFAAAVALPHGPGGRMLPLVGACVMGVSRPYLGMHYPTDVAAGALVGCMIGRLVQGRVARLGGARYGVRVR